MATGYANYEIKIEKDTRETPRKMSEIIEQLIEKTKDKDKSLLLQAQKINLSEKENEITLKVSVSEGSDKLSTVLNLVKGLEELKWVTYITSVERTKAE